MNIVILLMLLGGLRGDDSWTGLQDAKRRSIGLTNKSDINDSFLDVITRKGAIWLLFIGAYFFEIQLNVFLFGIEKTK